MRARTTGTAARPSSPLPGAGGTHRPRTVAALKTGCRSAKTSSVASDRLSTSYPAVQRGDARRPVVPSRSDQSHEANRRWVANETVWRFFLITFEPRMLGPPPSEADSRSRRRRIPVDNAVKMGLIYYLLIVGMIVARLRGAVPLFLWQLLTLRAARRAPTCGSAAADHVAAAHPHRSRAVGVEPLARAPPEHFSSSYLERYAAQSALGSSLVVLGDSELWATGRARRLAGRAGLARGLSGTHVTNLAYEAQTPINPTSCCGTCWRAVRARARPRRAQPGCVSTRPPPRTTRSTRRSPSSPFPSLIEPFDRGKLNDATLQPPPPADRLDRFRRRTLAAVRIARRHPPSAVRRRRPGDGASIAGSSLAAACAATAPLRTPRRTISRRSMPPTSRTRTPSICSDAGCPSHSAIVVLPR